MKKTSRLLSEREVYEAWEMLDYAKQCIEDQYPHGRVRAVVMAAIEEQKTQADHHHLGEDCPMINIDGLEIRGSHYVAIVENKLSDGEFTEFQGEFYPSFGERANLPALLINHYIPEGEATKYYPRKITHMGLKLSRTVDWREYKKFMVHLELYHRESQQMERWFTRGY